MKMKRYLILQPCSLIWLKQCSYWKVLFLKKNKNITDKSEKQKKKEIFAAPNSVLTNLSELVEKRSDIINQFNKKNIITKSKKFFEAPEKITESVTEEKAKKNLINQLRSG